MFRFEETKIAKKEFYIEKKKTIKIWNVNVGNIAISKLVKTETNFKYLTGYLDKDITPLDWR